MRHRAHNQLHTLSALDFEGYGVYEHDRPMGSLGSAMGNTAAQSIALKTLQTGIEEIGTLAHVPVASKGSSIQLLDAMVYTEDASPPIDGRAGTANLVIGEVGDGWASRMLNDGLVLMVDRESIPTGNVDVMATAKPATVALFAGMPNKVGGAQWVIVDGPAPIVNAAAALNAGGGPIPTEPGGGPGGGGIPLPPPPLPGGGIPGMPSVPGTYAPPCKPGDKEVMGLCFPLATAPHLPPCDPSDDLINGMCFPKPGGVVGPGGGGQQPAPGGGKAPQKPAKASVSNKAIVGGLVAVAAVGAIAIIAGRDKKGTRRSR